MDKMEKAIQLLRAEFGEEWQKIVQSLGVQDLCSRCGKELTSFIAYPERGEGGSSKWRGNCSPKVVEAILKYILDTKKYYRQDTSHFTLLDPMSGSGTSKAVADRFGVKSILYDLNPTSP
ncbi:MAG: SAM-dependent methyltransferase, partial [Clostridia bacterium]|nr:SAM-dependent methyltransferase [Clostridia bacterium]